MVDYPTTTSIGYNRCGASGIVWLYAGKHSPTLSRTWTYSNCGRKNAEIKLHATHGPGENQVQLVMNGDRIASLNFGNRGVPKQRCAEQRHTVYKLLRHYRNFPVFPSGAVRDFSSFIFPAIGRRTTQGDGRTNGRRGAMQLRQHITCTADKQLRTG